VLVAWRRRLKKIEEELGSQNLEFSSFGYLVLYAEGTMYFRGQNFVPLGFQVLSFENFV